MEEEDVNSKKNDVSSSEDKKEKDIPKEIMKSASTDSGVDGGAEGSIDVDKVLLKKYENWPLKDVAKPHKEHDVLYGRGGGTNHHPGNKAYRKLVEERKTFYMRSKRLEKPQIALDIVHMWRNQDPPGRFLKQNESTGLWSDVGDKKAREKTSQALREQAAAHRERSGGPDSATGGSRDSLGSAASSLKRKREDYSFMASPPPRVRAVTMNGPMVGSGSIKGAKIGGDNVVAMYISCAKDREESARNIKYDAQRMRDEAFRMEEEAKRLLDGSSRLRREAERMMTAADYELRQSASHLETAMAWNQTETTAVIRELKRSKSAGDSSTEKKAEQLHFDKQTNDNNESALPEGWKELSDPNTLKKYYFNENTNEVRWNRPSSAKVSGAVVPPPPPQVVPPMILPLQPGWEEILDRNSGKLYYYNKVLGETRWERPAAPPPPPLPPKTVGSTSTAAATTTTATPPPPPPPPLPSQSMQRSPAESTIKQWIKSGDTAGKEDNKEKDADDDESNKEGIDGLMKLQKSTNKQSTENGKTIEVSEI